MANGIYQRPDSPLNGDGIKQANAAAVRFKDIPIDIIWSSPLRRSLETAQIINKIINKKLVLENLLEEEHRPSEIIGKEKTDIKSIEIVKKLNQNYGRIGYRYSDEDTFENLKTRASDILQKLIKQAVKANCQYAIIETRRQTWKHQGKYPYNELLNVLRN